MICWSCQKEMSETAKHCPHCEAAVQSKPTVEEESIAWDVLSRLGPDVISEIRETLEKSSDGEDFVNRLMIGDCPSCGSSDTGDCENDPEIDDICVARCFACGQLWRPDCDELFVAGQPINHDCPAWEDMDFEEDSVDQ